MKIVALIPAHNEEAGIGAMVDSLIGQTCPPDRVIVMVDNSTDRTAYVAVRHGAEVRITRDNSAKKAGALNQGLSFVLRFLEDDDLIWMGDADSTLCSTWMEAAQAHLTRDPSLGAVSGAFLARAGSGSAPLMQRMEYAQERRRISRRGGRVSVLSGVAVLIPVRVLREILDRRGYIYDEKSLTEDYELTLCVQRLGYTPRAFKDLRVVTDVMDTWGDLYRQRLRWQRGTLETLWSYGWNDLTRKAWLAQALNYGNTLLILLMVCIWTLALMGRGEPDWRWLLILPVLSLEQYVTSRSAGPRARVAALLLVPMWGYTFFRLAVYWSALWKSLRQTVAVWA